MIDRRNPYHVYDLAVRLKNEYKPHMTFEDLSRVTGESIENVSLAVTRHWEFIPNQGYTIPPKIVQTPNKV